MKKVFMLLALLGCTLSGFAEKKFIQLEGKKRPHGRSEVLIPSAFIDGSFLTITLEDNSEAYVSVISSTGKVVYISPLNSLQSVIDLQFLEGNNYSLEIVLGNDTYVGNFSIEE